MPILQVVGYKKSGKTTVLEHLVDHCQQKGYRVGVIKHHGHGGKPDTIESDQTDTGRLRSQGAYATAVEGDGTLLIHIDSEETILLDQIISLYQQLPMDVIFIEGYKSENYPKVVVAENERDYKELKDKCGHIIATIIRFDPKDSLATSFSIEDHKGYCEFIMARIFDRS